MTERRSETGIGGPHRRFMPTLWTVILRAKDRTSGDCRMALEQLIHAYWRPVYGFIRGRGSAVEEAKDLTQGFFTHLLEHDFLDGVSREKGKFRTFLLRSLKNFLVNQARWEKAKKRGGGRISLSLDFDEAEEGYAYEATSGETVEKYFERQWAVSVMSRSLDLLSREMDPATFEAIKPHLSGGPSYEETARRLGMTALQLNNLIHKTRKRYRECVRSEVAASVADPDLVDEEIHDLFKALKS